MFDGAISFDQDISNWDVSVCYNFVSIAIDSIVVVIGKSENHVTYDFYSSCTVFMIFRILCSKEQQLSTKILAVGMCPMVLHL